ncbi:MAG: tetratricopeptide repeat protein [Planctomycetaceae bacterium]
MTSWTGSLLLVVASFAAAEEPPRAAGEHPFPEAERRMMNDRFDRGIGMLSKRINDEPPNLNLHSQRGDARMFLGRFKEAIADYDRMVEIDRQYDRSHWRRGIAYYFSGQYAEAIKQFDVYHEEDDVDREGGIWRYFAQYKKDSPEKAREGLQRYTKEDREPFNTLYEFFQGKLTADEVFAKIEKGSLEEQDKKRQLFYVHLYIGLDHAVAGREDEARKHLREAVANDWGRFAQYGPRYMWHVGRVEYDRLSGFAPKPVAPAKPGDKPQPQPDPGVN